MSTYSKVTAKAANGGRVLRRIGLVVAALVAVLVVGSFATSSVSTGPNQIAVQIGGGPIEDARFKGCVPAGTHENFNSPGDNYVTYSSSQRDWDATGQEGSDANPFKVVSADNVEMQVPIIVRFYQITDCATLEKFYTNLGQRYGAYIQDNGSGSGGWETMIARSSRTRSTSSSAGSPRSTPGPRSATTPRSAPRSPRRCAPASSSSSTRTRRATTSTTSPVSYTHLTLPTN